MEQKIRVILYGDSLFLNGIARSLEKGPDLEVVHIKGGEPGACLPSAGSGACLLAFDIQENPPELMLALFKETPRLTLLALDPESDRLLELSSQASGARTIEHLMEVIQRHDQRSGA